MEALVLLLLCQGRFVLISYVDMLWKNIIFPVSSIHVIKMYVKLTSFRRKTVCGTQCEYMTA